MYLEQRKRTELKTRVGNLQDFLKHLNISVKIKNAGQIYNSKNFTTYP